MSYLPLVALLTVLSFPCLAETPEERFSRMDLNKDGFLSEQEFVSGMAQAETAVLPAAERMKTLSAAEKQKLIDESVAEAKKILPFKVDQDTTWTKVYGLDSGIYYVYRLETDISDVPEERMSAFKKVMESQVCAKVRPAMCGIAKDTLLVHGISLTTLYQDKNSRLLARCNFALADCP